MNQIGKKNSTGMLLYNTINAKNNEYIVGKEFDEYPQNTVVN